MSSHVNNNVLNGKKKRGRPRAFDQGQALDAAVEVFWNKGFDGASLDDLTRAMGINRPSLYGAFGDKRRLFARALARYGEGIGSRAVEAFAAEAEIRAAVRTFFEVSLAHQARDGDLAPGCMIASCAPVVSETLPEVRETLAEALRGTEAALTARFAAEIAQGTLPEGFPAADRATIMADLIQAQANRARAGTARTALADRIPAYVAAILGPAT